jgi:hypothetical protein
MSEVHETVDLAEEPLPPIVEERLYCSLLCLSSLKHLALLAAAGCEPPTLVADVGRFALTARRMVIATERHLIAIQSVLPVSATDLLAPGRKGDDDDASGSSSRAAGRGGVGGRDAAADGNGRAGRPAASSSRHALFAGD